jgi:hypothetical protein
MQIKAQVMINGVAQTIFIDPNKDWVAVQFTALELQILRGFKEREVFIGAPKAQLASNRAAVMQWASEWPTRFFSGTHKAPEGALLLPNKEVKDQSGN